MKQGMSLIAMLMLFTGLLTSSPVLAWQQTGLEIMQAKKERHRLKFEKESVTMILKDRRGREKEREIVIYAMEDENRLSKGLIKFVEPEDVRNVGLLTWENAEQDDDQWLYLPSQRRAKRIAAGGKKNAFMGTDLAYEDLRPEDLEAHSYELKGSETIDGHDCHIIESLPATDKEMKESGYDKRIMWVRKDILIPLKTEFYSRGRLQKVMTVNKLEQLEDDVWRVTESTMETIRNQTSTTMRTDSRDTAEIDASMFTKRQLERNVD